MILITGATGFIGRALCHKLQNRESLRVVIHEKYIENWPVKFELAQASLSPDQNWKEVLADISTIVHCAARVHVMKESAANPLVEFRKVNVDGTLRLANEAAAAGVRRFVFISSIKVNGEVTSSGCPFTADQTPAPLDPYGISKWEAEQRLRTLGNETGMDIVIIRPVLVYGPGVKANFLHLMQWLHKGIPLPLGAIHNKRSMVALDNLVDLIVTCIYHPRAANQTFLVSDDEDLSTTDLIHKMSQTLGRPARLLPIPTWILMMAAAMVGKQGIAERLCGSLQVDITKTRELLGWKPTIGVNEGLRMTAEHFRAQLELLQR